jgi:hypothetical protein
MLSSDPDDASGSFAAERRPGTTGCAPARRLRTGSPRRPVTGDAEQISRCGCRNPTERDPRRRPSRRGAERLHLGGDATGLALGYLSQQQEAFARAGRLSSSDLGERLPTGGHRPPPPGAIHDLAVSGGSRSIRSAEKARASSLVRATHVRGRINAPSEMTIDAAGATITGIRRATTLWKLDQAEPSRRARRSRSWRADDHGAVESRQEE